MTYPIASINPHYAARNRRVVTTPAEPEQSALYARLPRAPRTSSPVPHLTSLYHFHRAGEYGDRSWPGNCGGNLIKDLLRYFQPGLVFDPMSGSGTAEDVCRELGIPCFTGDRALDAGPRGVAPGAGRHGRGGRSTNITGGITAGGRSQAQAARGAEQAAPPARRRPEPGPEGPPGRPGKKTPSPPRRRERTGDVQRRYQLSRRRACSAPAVPRSSHRFEGKRDPQDRLRGRPKEPAGAEVHHGYRRLYVLLRREGWKVNDKRAYRLYSEEGPTMRREAPRRSVSSQVRSERPAVEGADQTRAMDFMSDTLSDGRKIRVLTVLDVFTREGVALRADSRFTADRVVEVLAGLAAERGAPAGIRADDGPEFTGRSPDLRAYFNG
jgi:putative transposase